MIQQLAAETIPSPVTSETANNMVQAVRDAASRREDRQVINGR
jgi:hypothetical protein